MKRATSQLEAIEVMEATMTVIAMTREMGTLGKDVAQGIADSLGLRIVHSALIEHDLAAKMGVQESAVHRYLEGSPSLLERWKIDKNKLSECTAEEMLKIARDGNVIIRGWGAVSVLRHIPHVLRIRVCAPLPFRERVMMERLGHNEPSVVHREIEASDAAHARLMRGFFKINFEDPRLYHVVLNTGCVPVETCVRTVRLLADDPAFQETKATSALLNDKLVEHRVRSVLGGMIDGVGTNVSSIDIGVKDGSVILTGALLHNLRWNDAEKALRAIPGVTHVENRVQVVNMVSSGI